MLLTFVDAAAFAPSADRSHLPALRKGFGKNCASAGEAHFLEAPGLRLDGSRKEMVKRAPGKGVYTSRGQAAFRYHGRMTCQRYGPQ
jgi:hypothetical protein